MTLTGRVHNVRALGLAVIKTGKISGGINAMFASYPDVWAALHPALTAEGLSVGFCNATITLHGETEIVSMKLEVSDGTETLSPEFQMIVPEKILNSRGSSVTNNAQRVANAESYLKRTALIHYFGMSAGNEDEVERMMPAGDQTNTPGMIVMTERTTWQDLTDGVWVNAQSPLFDGMLKNHLEAGGSMKALWADFPNHPGLQAWAADYIVGALQELDLGWDDLRKQEATLPNFMASCNGEELRAAARTAKGLLDAKKGGSK